MIESRPVLATECICIWMSHPQWMHTIEQDCLHMKALEMSLCVLEAGRASELRCTVLYILYRSAI
jgi:hypothetical protein